MSATRVQEYVVIIAASIPSCKPLFRSSQRSGKYHGGSYVIGSWGRRRFLARQHPKTSKSKSSTLNTHTGPFRRLNGERSQPEASVDTIDLEAVGKGSSGSMDGIL
jgi:hypothetical protein